MASLRKRGKVWYYRFTDADGVRREHRGCSDKRATEDLARDAESDAAKIRNRLVTPDELACRGHRARPLSEHLAAWAESLESKGLTPKHIELATGRARRIVAIILGAKLIDIRPPNNAKRADGPVYETNLSHWVASARMSDLTAERTQKALATLKTEGRSLATCNHYRAAVKAFSKWCYNTHRTREDVLRGVRGFNANEDRRHDRRTISLEELRQLIEATEQGPVVMGMTGPARALAYRLAASTGLRYSEIASITPASFDWKAPGVTVAAAYTKNRQTAELPLPGDLVDDLAAYVAPLASGEPVFPLPKGQGAKMLRVDLDAAGIAYQDASGQFFDFHSLRCQMATNADAAGVTPRVVQKMMRHSTLELTGRYTRPRVVDIENAASLLPSLKPEGDQPQSLAKTGTDHHISDRFAHYLPTRGDAFSRDLSSSDVILPTNDPELIKGKPLQNEGLDASGRLESSSVATTGEGTPTRADRIYRPP
jgi:integrase